MKDENHSLLFRKRGNHIGQRDRCFLRIAHIAKATRHLVWSS
jgi:hypothetical protein